MPENIITELKKIFKEHTVLDIPRLQKLLHGRSKRSLFRDLKKTDGISSYSHAGKFHTLKKIPKFDSRGLWSFNGVRFSRYGTLGATITHWVNESPGGCTYSELKAGLNMRLENVLLELTKKKRIKREGVDGEYIYYSIQELIAASQRKYRQEINRQVTLSERVVIEVMAEVIRGRKLCVELQPLHDRLLAKGVFVTLRQIAQILELYQIKKTLGSRSPGRYIKR